jgi:hypothetical protein
MAGNKQTGVPSNRDYNANGDISRFKNGLLHGGRQQGRSLTAIELLNGHAEWWEDSYLHRNDSLAVIMQYGA